jgi:hypothetical protein
VLSLRRGTVASAEPARAGEPQRIEVDLDGERRPAIADVALVGESQPGDEVVVNVAARDLGLGSGGFDVVHVNLTRGLDGSGVEGAHVIKLNYTSLQHAVLPVDGDPGELPLARPVVVIALHGQLAPLAWALGQARPGARVGFVQTAGGALPAGLSDVVRELRSRELLAGQISAGPAYGAESEAITTAGALAHGLRELGWEAAICGPGPGILGSETKLGHGGLAALDSAHAALALGCETLIAPRMSSGDPRPRHRGISHHTCTVLELLLAPVVVALPKDAVEQPPAPRAAHETRRGAADLPGYAASGLPARTMGRGIDEDPLFFAAALAAGSVLAEMIG